MKKVTIFYGSNRTFNDLIPQNGRNLTDIVIQLDNQSRQSEIWVKGPNGEGSTPPKKKKIRIKNFIVHADEYTGVKEHVITNFVNFISEFSISYMYIQNPPSYLRDQVIRAFEGNVEEITQDYIPITADVIKTINRDFSKKIMGQEAAKEALLKAIYPIMNNQQEKPVVILFYGQSGIGKTETAHYLSNTVGGVLLRKQFSMYQNNEFANYLFGGKYNEKSFAKDLLGRDSNIILLDEFDKANPIFYSAFYQLFDEGIFEDQNYKINMKHSVIICTSNFQSLEDIKKTLGVPIYNRFDSIIEFVPLTKEAKQKIAINELNLLDNNNVLSNEVRERIVDVVEKCDSAREIKRLIKDSISLVEIRKICTE